jgi:hypothetical protein
LVGLSQSLEKNKKRRAANASPCGTAFFGQTAKKKGCSASDATKFVPLVATAGRRRRPVADFGGAATAANAAKPRPRRSRKLLYNGFKNPLENGFGVASL